MRTILILAVLALVGCGPGPKSARGDEPNPLTQAEFAKLQADLKAAGARDDDAPANALLKVNTSIGGVNTKLDTLTETVGNATSELEAVKSELSAVKAGLESQGKDIREIRSLLSVDTELSVPVPQEPPPVRVDAPPVEAGGNRLSGPTLNGKPLDVSATIAASYRRMWTFPGSIDDHLAEHGVAGAEGLDYETKRKLHSALHEQGNAPAKAVVKSRVVTTKPMALPQSCPNGQCPTYRPQYGYQQTRQRLFGRWR